MCCAARMRRRRATSCLRASTPACQQVLMDIWSLCISTTAARLAGDQSAPRALSERERLGVEGDEPNAPPELDADAGDELADVARPGKEYAMGGGVDGLSGRWTSTSTPTDQSQASFPVRESLIRVRRMTMPKPLTSSTDCRRLPSSMGASPLDQSQPSCANCIRPRTWARAPVRHCRTSVCKLEKQMTLGSVSRFPPPCDSTVSSRPKLVEVAKCATRAVSMASWRSLSVW